MSMTSASEDCTSSEFRVPQPIAALPPKMNICILVVGTRGDVEPFIAIAKRLQADGHRVRLATHAIYRALVTTQHNVEFYPLGGDPKVLSSYMVKTGGQLAPMNPKILLQDVPENMKIVYEICCSTWPAVTAADPDGGGPGVPGEPFRAHAIISNPFSYGHIHVAEKLSIPLHIMFPQPSAPTTAFPHPLSPLTHSRNRKLLTPSKRNRWSYNAVYALLWLGSETNVNRLRTDVLGLRKLRLGDGGASLLLDPRIPHSYLWSPSLVPKPADWTDLYDVVGTATLPATATPLTPFTPSPELEAFLRSDNNGDDDPIFVGFGSMVFQNAAKTTQLILDAAERANVRVLIQSNWSDMTVATASMPRVRDSVFFLNDCPHDWLMPRVSAVVHHGGAGTTAAGLLAGKPTFIVPFFSDQHFWGRAVVAAGVGLEPCPIRNLTVARLAQAFEALQDPTLKARARALAAQMAKEDGAGAAVERFYRHLPVVRMRCEAQIESACTRAATMWRLSRSQRLCDACARAAVAENEHDVVPLCVVDYAARGPDSAIRGACAGTGALLHEVAGGVKDVLVKPFRGFRDRGAAGAVSGLASAAVGLVVRPVRGVVLLADHVAAGHCNAHRAPHERKRDSVFIDVVERKLCCLR